ncbi:MAG: hypothetical protein PHG16_06240 [Lachnospiraceae bacterium]|nr:hypothetical protein [Lachnospiraceae bacterium]
MENKGYPVNSIRICIDETDSEQGLMSGKIYGVAIEQPIVFRNSSELLLAIDDALNQIGKPQASSVIRSFKAEKNNRAVTYRGDPPRYHGYEEIRAMQGEQLTRDICFTSRQHSTWQGFVQIEEEPYRIDFASDLELLKYLLKYTEEETQN